MNRLLKITFLFLLSSYSIINAQECLISNVEKGSYKGVYEIEDIGYAVHYKEKKGEWILQIRDKQLKKIAKTTLSPKVKGIGDYTCFSNGQSFIVLVSRGAKNHHVLAYDYSGKLLKRMNIEENISAIVPAKDKGFYVMVKKSPKKEPRIFFWDNKLKKQWDVKTPCGTGSASLSASKEKSGGIGTLMPALPGTFSCDASEDALIWGFADVSSSMSRKAKTVDVAGISIDGKILFHNSYSPEDRVYGAWIHKDNVYLLGSTSSKKKNTKGETWFKKLSMSGEVLETEDLSKEDYEKFNKKGSSNCFGSFSIDEFKETPKGFILVGSTLNHFRLWTFNKDMRFEKIITLKKRNQMSLSSFNSRTLVYLPMLKNYKFILPSNNEEDLQFVYSTRIDGTPETLLISTKDGKWRFIDDLEKHIKKEDVNKRWIDFLPADEGKGVLVLNKSKEKQIKMITVDLE
ncbi:MAG: hypothetical protein AB8F74_09425 [Saprospiraceae bacterium]